MSTVVTSSLSILQIREIVANSKFKMKWHKTSDTQSYHIDRLITRVVHIESDGQRHWNKSHLFVIDASTKHSNIIYGYLLENTCSSEYKQNTAKLLITVM